MAFHYSSTISSILLVCISLLMTGRVSFADPMYSLVNNKNLHCVEPVAKKDRQSSGELWCGMEDGSSHPSIWFSVHGTSHLSFMPWLSEGQAIHGISVSDSGKYLSIIHAGEGHPYLVVYDIEKLRQAADDRYVYHFNPYPGSVGLYRWDGDTLMIETDYPVGKENTDEESLTEGFIYSVDLKRQKLKYVGKWAKQ